MKQIKHLILTPFNFMHFCQSVNSLDDEWMEKRMQIFLDVTYPSLMSQTVMDFEWIVGFDPQTSTKWIEKINDIKGISVIYPDKHTSKIWPEIIKSYVDKPYLLTTRIDNDDAFANNAIETIQLLAEQPPPRYINLLHGIVSDGDKIYLLDYKSNSFISRLEESQKAESVRTIDHTRACGTPGFQQVDDLAPMWLIYIHDNNYGWTMETATKGPLRSHRPAPENALDNFNININ